MSDSVQPVPSHLHTVGAYLCVKGCAAAIEFYKKAFGATERSARIADGEGTVGHAEVVIGDTTLYMSDEHPEMGVQSPETLGGSPVFFVLNVPDCESLFQQAVAAGAEVLRPVADQFYGARSGTVQDPYGYRWTISTQIENVSDEEIAARFAKMMEEGGNG